MSEDAPLLPEPAKVFYWVPFSRDPKANMVASFEIARAEAADLGMARYATAKWDGFSGSIEAKRNRAVDMFLETDAEYLMMIDDDMDFRPDLKAIAKLIAAIKDTDADAVAPLMVRRDPPHWVCFNEKRFVPDDLKRAFRAHRDDAFIECTGHLGTGCILINRRVFSKIPRPWFKTETSDRCRVCLSDPANAVKPDCKQCDGTGTDKYGTWICAGEDTYFSRKIVDAGGKIVLAAGVIVGHIGEACLTVIDSVRVGDPVGYAEVVLKRHDAMQEAIKKQAKPELEVPGTGAFAKTPKNKELVIAHR